MRHENTALDEEEGFTSRESAIISVPNPAAPKGKGRRSLEDMMASQPNEVLMSAYALERIGNLEDTIEKVLKLCTPEALALVLKQRPSLRRYAPKEDEEEDE